MNSSSKYVLAVATVTLAVSCGILLKLLESTATQDQNNMIDDQRYGEVLNRLADLQNQVARLNQVVQDSIVLVQSSDFDRIRLSPVGKSLGTTDNSGASININVICQHEAGRPSGTISCFDNILDQAGGKILEGTLEDATPSDTVLRPVIRNVSSETIVINEVTVAYTLHAPFSDDTETETEPDSDPVHGDRGAVDVYRCESSILAPTETIALSCEKTKSDDDLTGYTFSWWDVDSVSVYVD